MSGRLGMTGDAVAYGDKEFGKIAATRKPERSDHSGAAVGAGTALAVGGFAAGGVPGKRSDFTRRDKVAGAKTKREMARHLASAGRGGIFGFREDAHRNFVDARNKELRGWRAHPEDIGNNFERGVTQGKTGPEKTIVRQMHRARIGSHYALAGGGALAAGGLLLHRRDKLRNHRSQTRTPIRKRDKDYKSNAFIAGGATLAAGGIGGAEVLEHQGNKWAGQAAHHIREAQKINPHLGGVERNTKRHRKVLGPTRANVPDMQPHRSTRDIVDDAWMTQRGQNRESAIAAGKHRGAATQARYFARIYGRQARFVRRAGVGGAAIAGLGITGRHFEVKRKTPPTKVPLRKGILGTENWSDKDWSDHQQRVNARFADDKKSGKSKPRPREQTPRDRANHAPTAPKAVHAPAQHTPQLRPVDSFSHKELLSVARRAWNGPSHLKRNLAVTGSAALLGGGSYALGRRSVASKAATLTMSDSDAHRLAQRYDTRGPLPKKLSREAKMKAYEARYIASGGRKAEKWKRRANAAEVGRNVGLAGATGGALLTLAARGKKMGPKLARVKINAHRADNATIGSAAFGGASELYGEHARSRRASYQNSPAGVAGSALSRMQAYTPEKKP